MPRRWPGRTGWDRWTAAGAPWSSRSPSPTRTTDDDALEEAWAAHGMAQPGQPAGIAGDGVDRGGQRRNRIDIEASAIEPRTASPSGLARRRQREQGGQCDEALAQQERRPVGLGRVVEADTGRLGR